MQVGARFNPPLGSTAGNNGDIVRPPVLSLGPGRRLLNWLYSSRAKWGLNGPFMPPKDPIVIGMRMHEPARVYRRFLDFPLKCWRCFHVLDVANESA
ncbi:hypothetical protein ABVT39_012341 [Epinephelus coioides]